MPDADVPPRIRLVRAPNPGPMTLTGTNTYIVRGGGATVIVDPGPDLDAHLEALPETIDLILVTHRHRDHLGAAVPLAVRTGAPIRAIDPALCRDAEALRDEERIELGTVRLDVVATPGHTSDSVAFIAPDAGAIFTGDTLLGGSSTVLDHPDGTLADYLATLERLGTLDAGLRIHPGHGEPGAALGTEVARTLRHRHARLAQVREAVAQLGPDADVESVLEVVYAEAPPRVLGAARMSLAAQLAYLRGA